MSEEIKPCPFCGGEALVIKVAALSIDFTFYDGYQVSCQKCSATAPLESYDTEKNALAAWNRRADRWIPVSESLPEKEGHYFVTAQLWNGNTEAQITYWTGPEREPSNQFNLHCRAVTAWRPLPEPWREGE